MKKPHSSLAKEVCDCLHLISTHQGAHAEVTIRKPISSVSNWSTGFCFLVISVDSSPCSSDSLANTKAKQTTPWLTKEELFLKLEV